MGSLKSLMSVIRPSGVTSRSAASTTPQMRAMATMPVRENFIRKMGDLGRQLVDQCLAADR